MRAVGASSRGALMAKPVGGATGGSCCPREEDLGMSGPFRMMARLTSLNEVAKETTVEGVWLGLVCVALS